MGRLAAFVADALALARLTLELRAAWRANARLGAPAEPPGAPDVGRAAEAGQADRPGGVGSPGPDQGPPAGQGAGPVSGPVTRG